MSKQGLLKMHDERKQIRIGELLMEAGIVASEYIKNALQNFEQRGLPIGKVLVMSGYLSEQQLRTALEVQSLINDGLLPIGVAVNVLQISHKDRIPLAEAFQLSGFVQPEDQQTNKLGQLLVGAGIVQNSELDEALQTNIRTGLPLGHIFCFSGAVSQSIIWTGLLCQQLIRKGMVSREMAIQALRDSWEREYALEQLPINKGFQRVPMRPTIKLGDLLVEAKLLTEHQLNEGLHRTLMVRRPIGEVLVGHRIVSQDLIDAAIDLQEMIDNNTVTTPLAVEALMMMRANSTPLAVAVAQVGAYKARENRAVTLLNLLTSSGTLPLSSVPAEVQECVEVNYNQSRQVVNMLLQAELVPAGKLYNALRCVYLIEEKNLDLERAIMAIDFAARQDTSVDLALLALGLTMRTRLRTD